MKDEESWSFTFAPPLATLLRRDMAQIWRLGSSMGRTWSVEFFGELGFALWGVLVGGGLFTCMW